MFSHRVVSFGYRVLLFSFGTVIVQVIVRPRKAPGPRVRWIVIRGCRECLEKIRARGFD